MPDFVELRPGMRVTIPSPEGADAGTFTSFVRRVNEHGVLIDAPQREGEDLYLRPGQPITMTVQIHSRLYRFETQVVASDFQVLLEEPSVAEQTERRAFYRLMLSIPAVVTFDRGSEAEPLVEHVMIRDLSGGGTRVRVSDDLPVGTRFQIAFPLGVRPFELPAEVVATSHIEHARGSTRHEAHCKFTGIQRREQDEIVHFITRKQREFAQRGVA